jgi:hypothetical protein
MIKARVPPVPTSMPRKYITSPSGRLTADDANIAKQPGFRFLQWVQSAVSFNEFAYRVR